MPGEIACPRIDPASTPFERTKAFLRFGADVTPNSESPEEPYTKAIIQEQGFDGWPEVVSSVELDASIRSGDIEIFRGVSDEVYAEQFRTGEFFIGRGAYGSGAYAVGGRHGLVLARGFAGSGVVLRMALRHSARVADYETLEAAAYQSREQAVRRLRLSALATDESPEVISQQRHGSMVEAIHAQYDDIGRYAAYLGYDAIEVGGFD
ncbi:MAG: hypothetical protein HYX51_06100 [Chloroflexi bacterium]|nr:hypothetical protein [Chloroflexota bacterium]